MVLDCIWEHNGDDTLLYAADYPGAYSRGSNLQLAKDKMKVDLYSYLSWIGLPSPDYVSVHIIQDAPCKLTICDADSDVLFDSERRPLTKEEYGRLKMLTLKSARDFLALYDSIPEKNLSNQSPRSTFYGSVPRTANEMYQHTKNVNAYYFGEIDAPADNVGSILSCRENGFDKLEQSLDFLDNSMIEGSYGELWTLRKVFRRFIWHDRIHAKAMYRLGVSLFGKQQILDPFCFGADVCTKL